MQINSRLSIFTMVDIMIYLCTEAKLFEHVSVCVRIVQSWLSFISSAHEKKFFADFHGVDHYNLLF